MTLKKRLTQNAGPQKWDSPARATNQNAPFQKNQSETSAKFQTDQWERLMKVQINLNFLYSSARYYKNSKII